MGSPFDEMLALDDQYHTLAFHDQDPQTPICFNQPFWIDQSVVWQGQFSQFNGRAAAPSTSTDPMRPIGHLTWAEANVYCIEKRGGRLPTEAEWEYVARGPNGLRYPWGNVFDATKAIYSSNSSNKIEDVNRTDGISASWVGAQDMSGNIWQWTSSLYRAYPYNANDGREDHTNVQESRVIRGGPWSPGGLMRTTNRYSQFPTAPLDVIGFRCVRSA